MAKSVERRVSPALAIVALAAMFALAACGGKKTTATNIVEMHDMEVVDGTINDSMTDLDAARSDSTALDNSSNASAPGPAARRAPRDGMDKAEKNAEAVAVE